MAEKNKAPRPDLRGASKKDRMDAGSASLQATAPFCRCPRTGDLWLCAGRPELINHPDGSRCALGATVRASGNDHDPRGELERALKEAGCRE